VKIRDLVYVGRSNYFPMGHDIRIGHWVFTIAAWFHKEVPFR
jgi:hypothetical protein